MFVVKLDVGMVFEGSVCCVGNCVCIIVQLIDVVFDLNLWVEMYDCELCDVFVIQDDIVQSIVDVLKVILLLKECCVIQYVVIVNVQVYDDYLCGCRYFYVWNWCDLLCVIDMYKCVIVCDFKYVVVWVGLLDVYVMWYCFLDVNFEYVVYVMDVSECVLQMDLDLVEVYVLCGLVLYVSKCFKQVEWQFEMVMMFNLNLFEVYFLYGMICSLQGNFEKVAWFYLCVVEVSLVDYLLLVYLSQVYSEMGCKDDECKVCCCVIELIECVLGINFDDVCVCYMGVVNFVVIGEKDKVIEWVNLVLCLSEDELMVYYNVVCMFVVLEEYECVIDLFECVV